MHRSEVFQQPASTVEATVIGRTVRIQTPLKGCRVDASYYDHSCFNQLCFISTFYAGDSGQVYVPLMHCSDSGVCYWWDLVHIKFPIETAVAYWDNDGNHETDAFRGALDLYPATRSEDRIWNLTVEGAPFTVRILSALASIHDFYLWMYGYAPPQIRVWYGSRINSGYDDGLQVTADSTMYYRGVDWVLAHEYAHQVQHYTYGYGAKCCNLVNCVHSYCSSQCVDGAWTEGMAHGMAEFYCKEIKGGLRLIGYANCGPGTDIEYNVGYFVYLMSERDPRGFMDTFRLTKVTLNGIDLDHVRTASDYYGIWRDRDPDPGWIVVHHPGTWNADAIWRYTIEQQRTGVEPISAAALPIGIHAMYPNPGLGRLRLLANLPSLVNLYCDVFDVSGRLIESVPYPSEPAGIRELELNTAGFPAGILFIQLRSVNGRVPNTSRKVAILK